MLTAARASDRLNAELGPALRRAELIDELSLKRAEAAMAQTGMRLDRVLSNLGLVSEAALGRTLAGLFNLAYIEAEEARTADVLADAPVDFLRRSRILPLREEGGHLWVACADPLDEEPAVALGYLIGRPVARTLAAESVILSVIEQRYGRAGVELEAAGASEGGASEDDARRLEDLASEAPIIKLVQDLIVRAAQMRASDIHLEPREDCLRVRYRIDGTLHTVETLPPAATPAIISRIKIMARLNIAERRQPQDGRIRANVRGRDIDLRISTMPTLKGERIALRLLDRSQIPADIPALGLSEANEAALLRLISEPNGMLLVTGPTGSGKTTTLYTAMRKLAQPHNNTFTVEDPIEYQLEGVNQIQVKPQVGLTFANALRSLLRQDPDIIMVGEIRDGETAQIAVQAALTGHLVLSTLHTNSAAASIARLVDMGVERYLLASTLRGVLAQRLVRRLCPHCAQSAGQDEQALVAAQWGAPLPARTCVRVAVGCEQCRGTGYLGRRVVSELLVVTPSVREQLIVDATESRMAAVAAADGMQTMKADGLALVLRGETSLDEVLRVTRAA